MMENVKDTLQKTAYASIGYPTVLYKQLKSDFTGTIENWATEGQTLVHDLRDVEIETPAQLAGIEEQATKLRTQLNDLIENWRENFNPEQVTETVEKKAKEATETVQKKAAEATESVQKAATGVTAKVANSVTDTQWKEDLAEAVAPIDLTEIKGIGPATAKKLKAGGIADAAAVARSRAERVADAAGVSMEKASEWIASARQLIK